MDTVSANGFTPYRMCSALGSVQRNQVGTANRVLTRGVGAHRVVQLLEPGYEMVDIDVRFYPVPAFWAQRIQSGSTHHSTPSPIRPNRKVRVVGWGGLTDGIARTVWQERPVGMGGRELDAFTKGRSALPYLETALRHHGRTKAAR